MKKIIFLLKLFFIGFIFLFFIVFAIRNNIPVQLKLIGKSSFEFPLILLVLDTFLFGILIGSVVGYFFGKKVSKAKIEEINIQANENIANYISQKDSINKN